jgi:hypothetical protein
MKKLINMNLLVGAISITVGLFAYKQIASKTVTKALGGQNA